MTKSPQPPDGELSGMIREMWLADIVKLQQALNDSPTPEDAERYRNNIQVLTDWLHEERLFYRCC